MPGALGEVYGDLSRRLGGFSDESQTHHTRAVDMGVFLASHETYLLCPHQQRVSRVGENYAVGLLMLRTLEVPRLYTWFLCVVGGIGFPTLPYRL